jgi:hypothetical protein
MGAYIKVRGIWNPCATGVLYDFTDEVLCASGRYEERQEQWRKEMADAQQLHDSWLKHKQEEERCAEAKRLEDERRALIKKTRLKKPVPPPAPAVVAVDPHAAYIENARKKLSGMSKDDCAFCGVPLVEEDRIRTRMDVSFCTSECAYSFAKSYYEKNPPPT